MKPMRITLEVLESTDHKEATRHTWYVRGRARNREIVTASEGYTRRSDAVRFARRLATAVFKVATPCLLVLAAAGCTTGRLVLMRPDGTRVVAIIPGDVTLRGVEWGDLKIERYTRTLNVGAIEAQGAIVGEAVGAAVKAAVRP